MLGVLLESNAGVQRRSGGMALSVVTHVALIGLATAATVHSAPASPEKPKVEIVVFKRPPEPKPAPVVQNTPPALAKLVSAPSVPTISLAVPKIVPPSLPPIDAGATPTSDDVIISRGGSTGQNGRPSLLDQGPAESSNEWRGTEVLMHVLASGKPRYPEALRQAGIDGSVLIQFTVDTLGRVDMGSVKILKSTHDMFTDAVRQSLGAFRFKPAEVNGRRVPALAQMPFEFHLGR
jgi:protein TonB